MTRPFTDLANDLRDIANHPFDVIPLATDISVEASAAADILDMLATLLPQPVCDECGGSGIVNGRWDHRDGHELGDPCPSPHCDHGRLKLDVWLQRVAALVKTLPDIYTLQPQGGVEPIHFINAIAKHFTQILYPQLGRQP